MLALVPISFIAFRERKRRTRWLRQALHHGARMWVDLTQRLLLIHVVVKDHREAGNRLDNSDKPTLVISNHPSLIDVLLISAAIPNLCCVLKGNLHYNPLFTFLIKYLDYLPNSDPEKMLEEGSARLRAGETLLIFPEGTRSAPPPTDLETAVSAKPPLVFRFGAAELARRSGANALPVVIHYNDRYFRKGHPWYRLPPNIMRFRLEIGPTVPGFGPPPTPPSTRSERKQVRNEINQAWINYFEERLNSPGMGN